MEGEREVNGGLKNWQPVVFVWLGVERIDNEIVRAWVEDWGEFGMRIRREGNLGPEGWFRVWNESWRMDFNFWGFNWVLKFDAGNKKFSGF